MSTRLALEISLHLGAGLFSPPKIQVLTQTIALILQYTALMDNDVYPLATAIGIRIKQERQLQGRTLDQLAELAGVSRRTIASVEQGNTNPSVGILLKISDALGIGLPSLVEPPRPPFVRVVRNGKGAALWSGKAGGSGVLIAGTEPPDVVELWDWHLGPHDSYESEAHSSGTRELLHVLQGTVTIEVADQAYALEVGDAVSFHGDVAHTYTNPSKTSAHFSLAVFQPRVGTSTRSDNDA
nr:XRE family transcriptional regulator [Ferrimicrobium acidiphilum]